MARKRRKEKTAINRKAIIIIINRLRWRTNRRNDRKNGRPLRPLDSRHRKARIFVGTYASKNIKLELCIENEWTSPHIAANDRSLMTTGTLNEENQWPVIEFWVGNDCLEERLKRALASKEMLKSCVVWKGGASKVTRRFVHINSPVAWYPGEHCSYRVWSERRKLPIIRRFSSTNREPQTRTTSI